MIPMRHPYLAIIRLPLPPSLRRIGLRRPNRLVMFGGFRFGRWILSLFLQLVQLLGCVDAQQDSAHLLVLVSAERSDMRRDVRAAFQGVVRDGVYATMRHQLSCSFSLVFFCLGLFALRIHRSTELQRGSAGQRSCSALSGWSYRSRRQTALCLRHLWDLSLGYRRVACLSCGCRTFTHHALFGFGDDDCG